MDNLVTWSQHTQVGERNEDDVLDSFSMQVEPEGTVVLFNYLISDKYSHLVKVDNPMVSQGKKLFVSGTIEFLDAKRTGVKLGPITSWWITLRDQTHYFGVTTASCSYLPRDPVAVYLSIMAGSSLFR